MKFKYGIVVAGIIALAAFGAWALPDDHHRGHDRDWDDADYIKDEQSLEADLNGINLVRMRNVNGSIVANIGGSNTMSLLVKEKVKESSKIDAQELIAEAKVISYRQGSTLFVEIDYGRFKDHKYKGHYQSSYEVTLPKRLNIDFETTNGKISAPAFDGDVKLETTNGSVHSKGAGGKANLETTNGSIYITMVSGSVEAETTNGSIEITSIAGPVTAETTNGSIEIMLKEALAGDVELSTTNGNIIFRPGSGSSYSVKADTSNGKVYASEALEFNKRRNYARGTIGGGKYKVTLDTTNGSIRIK